MRRRHELSDQRAGQAGFTLIELMITVVVVAILLAIAVPAYNQYTADARRQDGRELLLNTSQLLERCYTSYGSYTDADCNVAFPRDSQEGWYQVPQDGNDGMDLNANDYTLVAVPQDDHAGDDCGNLTLASTGAEGVDGASLTAEECWGD